MLKKLTFPFNRLQRSSWTVEFASVMNCIGLLLTIDRHLSALLGFSSPWAAHANASILCKAYSYVTQVVTCLTLNVAQFDVSRNLNSIIYRLGGYLIYLVSFETIINAFAYNRYGKNFQRFLENFFRHEDYLNSTLLSREKREGIKDHCKELLLCLANLLSFLGVLCIVYHSFSLIQIVGILRNMVGFEMALQWSLCMHAVDRKLSDVHSLLKATLRDTSGTSRRKRIETVVKVYRIVAKRRKHVNEHYGPYVAVNICVTLYTFIVLTYICWYKVARVAGKISWWLILVELFVDLVAIVLKAAICEEGTSKVKQWICVKHFVLTSCKLLKCVLKCMKKSTTNNWVKLKSNLQLLILNIELLNNVLLY